jgi:hypothetical protein
VGLLPAPGQGPGGPHDAEKQRQLRDAADVFFVPRGTRAQVLSEVNASLSLRILDGDYAGRKVYARLQDTKPATGQDTGPASPQH